MLLNLKSGILPNITAKVSDHEQSRIYFRKIISLKIYTKKGYFHGVQTNYDIYMHSQKSEHNVR